MENDSCFRNLAQKPIAVSDPLAELLWRADNEVHGEWCSNGHANPDGLTHDVACRHHHQQIHVAPLALFAARVRTEQDHLVRLERLDDLANGPADCRQGMSGDSSWRCGFEVGVFVLMVSFWPGTQSASNAADHHCEPRLANYGCSRDSVEFLEAVASERHGASRRFSPRKSTP